MSDSLHYSSPQINRVFIAADTTTKLVDLKTGDRVLFDGRLYRVYEDAYDGKNRLRLWFIGIPTQVKS